jgi:ACR3 family arsenite efflux pump ArsB
MSMQAMEIVVIVLLLIVAVLAVVIFAQNRSVGASYPPETKNALEGAQKMMGLALGALVLMASKTEGKTDDQVVGLVKALFTGLGVEVPEMTPEHNAQGSPPVAAPKV